MFFASPIGYVVIGVFLLIMGLMLWVFNDTSILETNYAGMDQLFYVAPTIFVFLIPAITMRSFSEELQFGTMELLKTMPIKIHNLLLGKYFASLALVVLALIPTLIYYYSVYQLGSPRGNIDAGATMGSYIGLIFLSASLIAIGIFCSSLTKNQIVAFVLACLIGFLLLWGFDFIKDLPIFFGKIDNVIQKLGINYHYNSMSKGMIDTRDVLYFLSVSGFFLYLTFLSIKLKSN